jgi:hypothetical protein
MNDMFIKLVCDIQVLMEMFQTNRICKRFLKTSYKHVFIVMLQYNGLFINYVLVETLVQVLHGIISFVHSSSTSPYSLIPFIPLSRSLLSPLIQ